MVTIFIRGVNNTNLIINFKYQAIWTILSHKKLILHLSCFCSTPTVECVNFKGSKNIICQTCKVTDNEVHRLNHCKRFRATNYYDNPVKPNFDDVYSSDINVLKNIVAIIEKTWNTRNAHGSMMIHET